MVIDTVSLSPGSFNNYSVYASPEPASGYSNLTNLAVSDSNLDLGGLEAGTAYTITAVLVYESLGSLFTVNATASTCTCKMSINTRTLVPCFFTPCFLFNPLSLHLD